MNARCLLLLVPLLAACSSSYSARRETLTRAVTRPAMPCDAQGGYDCDRRAILAMAGNYRVSFHFEETVLLSGAYQPKAAKDVSGTEAVVVVSDAPNRIELQHLLVITGGIVVKHWRQVWEYEAPRHFVFTGAQRFEPKDRTEDERKGTWTQLVFEVSDAPRYAGAGKWNHKYGVSTWTSERTWRPLPRREYTTRSDYDLINAQNRHTVTPFGWTHEQDNTKVVRKDGKDTPLVREFGFNEYTLVDDPLTPAHAYWKETEAYWAEVRSRWSRLLEAGPVTLAYPVDEEDKLVAVLKEAEAFRKSKDLAAANAFLDRSFAAAVVAPTTTISSKETP